VTYRAVLFDLDGTLADTLQDLADSTNAVLQRHGGDAQPVDAYRYFVGDGLRNLIKRALTAANMDLALTDEVMAQTREEYGRRQFDTTALYPGIEEMLDELEWRDMRLAVLSNKPHDFTMEMVGRLCGEGRFELVQGQTDGLPRKPDPASAVRVAERMNLSPAEFLYLGDTNTDMQTATGAGMFAVGVLWGFRDEAELRDNGAQALISKPAELLDLLGE
jgi:phosphoglycolate phosphatase